MKDTDIIAATAPDAVSLMDKAIAEIKRLRQENATLTAERDEARRMLCEEWAKQDGLPLDWQGRRGAEGMAEFVKWDCFKEASDERHC